MQWRYLFTRDNLNRGYDLYKEGKTSKVGTDSNGNYWATVEGMLVEIGNYEQGALYTSCECRYAKIGLRCKHMAATLFAIEEMAVNEALEAKKSRIVVHPFRREQMDSKYRFFDLDSIMECQVIFENTYRKALELIETDGIKIDSIKTEYDISHSISKNKQLECKIRATAIGKPVNNIVEINMNRHKITQAICGCVNCRKFYNSYYGDGFGNRMTSEDKENLCAHQIAALLLAKDMLEKTNPGDATDRNGMDFLKAFKRKRIIDSVDNENIQSNLVFITPRIEGPGLSLGFKIGKDKRYVVKNLANLVNCVENKDRMALGKKEELNFATDRFDETSKKYYRLIKRVVKDEENQAEYFYGDRYHSGSTIKLYGSRMDYFYKMVENMKIEAAKNYSNSVNGVVRFIPGDISLKLEVNEIIDNSIFQGINVEGYFPELIEGAEHRYYESDGCVYKIAGETEDKLLPFIEAGGLFGLFSVNIGRKNLSDFYYNVLPQIQDFVQVEGFTDELIEKYIPPKAEYVFYLDMEDTDIICKAMVVYGEEEYYLSDCLDWNREFADIRNREEELEISQTIEKIFENVNPEKREYYCNNDEDRIYYILQHGINDLLELGEVQTTDAFRKLKIKRTPKITVGVSVQSDLMNLNITSDELSKEELLDILFKYKKKKKYYRLKNGDFINLQDDAIDELTAMVEAMHLSAKDFAKDNMKLPLYRALYMDKLIEENDEIYAKRDSYFKSVIKDFKTFKDSDFDLPASLEGVMRNYQKHGFRWLKTLEKCHFGGILADDMGLGKTLQVISFLLSNKEENGGGTAIIIAPASLIFNWKEEISRFAPALTVMVIEGSQKQREELIEEYSDYDVVVTSYDLLKRDIALYENCSFKYQIIDEAQYIKNHTTAAAKAVKVIKSTTRFALTGTPIENRLSELWSIFDYLMPGFLYNYDTFKDEIEYPISREQDPDAKGKLKKMVSPFILRRLKEDVLKDLPDKVEEHVYAIMDEEQQRLYDGQVVYMKEMINSSSDESFARNKIQLLAELTKIRQICCDPTLIFDNYKGESSKRQACMELVKSAIEGKHRMLIFSQFTSMLDLLKKDLDRDNIQYYEITGSTPKQDRLKLVKEFNEGTIPVFLISLKAGGTGLNLIGADIVIHYDPWWNVAAQNQATDRAHRIGQTKSVSVYKLIIKNSIEEKIVKLQETKKQLAEEILMGEMGNISSMSREDLLELME